MTKAAVIIPYFQRQPGLLSKAIQSVAAQRGDFNITVLVVDDGSPLPAESDIPHGLPPSITVRVVKQQNGGAAVARNEGLQRIADGTELVAFLDSDDTWLPGHLANARTAINAGADLYFANYFEPNELKDQFSRHGRLDPAAHQRITSEEHLYFFAGDMLTQLLAGNVIETSTVVLNWPRMHALRFRSDFVNAFEDHLFWMDAWKQGARFAFGMAPECQYGAGVSVWRGMSFFSDKALTQIALRAKYLREVRMRYARSSEHAGPLEQRRSELRRDTVAYVLHRLRRQQSVSAKQMLAILKADPTLAIRFVPIALRIAIEQAARRSW